MKQKKEKEKPKFKYPLKSFRIAPEIYEELLEAKDETETWNLFFRRIIKNYGNTIKTISKRSNRED